MEFSLHNVLLQLLISNTPSFFDAEPIQATLDPIAQGIRKALEMGDPVSAMYNTIYYSSRSFNSGKNVEVLLREVEALARQLGKSTFCH